MLGFLCYCVLIVSYIASGTALSLLIDGIGPTLDLWNAEAIGFNGIVLSSAMIYFELLSYAYMSFDFDKVVLRKGFPFNSRRSPVATVFWTATLLGAAQAVVVMSTWRLSVASGYYWCQVIWGILTIALTLFVFTLVTQVTRNAKGLMQLETHERTMNQLLANRKQRNKRNRAK